MYSDDEESEHVQDSIDEMSKFYDKNMLPKPKISKREKSKQEKPSKMIQEQSQRIFKAPQLS